MKRFFPLLTASLIILNIAGCGSNDFDAGASSSSSSFTQGDKNFLLKLFHSEYLWYDHVPDQVDLSAYTTPQSMIEALKYKAKDRWSFALSQEDYSHFLNQTGGGFGIGFDRNMRVKFVRIDAALLVNAVEDGALIFRRVLAEASADGAFEVCEPDAGADCFLEIVADTFSDGEGKGGDVFVFVVHVAAVTC